MVGPSSPLMASIASRVSSRSRGQRIFFRRDCLGKFKTPAAVLEGLAIWTSDDLRKLPRDFVAETGWISTNKDTRSSFDFAIHQNKRVGRRVIFDEPAVDLALQ